MTPFDYSNLFDYWLKQHQQPTPASFQDVLTGTNSPPFAWLKPEDMAAVLNAYSPYDLFMKPDYAPKNLDYGTPAFNINNHVGNLGIQELITMASQAPQKQLNPLMSVLDYASGNYQDIPTQYREYIPQAIMAHEMTHYNDPRLNPMANNYGYLTREGLPGNIASREIPAMRAEDIFWHNLINNKPFGKL